MGSAIGVQWSGTTEEVWAVITVGQSKVPGVNRERCKEERRLTSALHMRVEGKAAVEGKRGGRQQWRVREGEGSSGG